MRLSLMCSCIITTFSHILLTVEVDIDALQMTLLTATGAVYINTCPTANVTGNFFLNNRGTSGAAIRFFQTNGNADSNTFVGNIASNAGSFYISTGEFLNFESEIQAGNDRFKALISLSQTARLITMWETQPYMFTLLPMPRYTTANSVGTSAAEPRAFSLPVRPPASTTVISTRTLGTMIGPAVSTCTIRPRW